MKCIAVFLIYQYVSERAHKARQSRSRNAACSRVAVRSPAGIAPSKHVRAVSHFDHVGTCIGFQRIKNTNPFESTCMCGHLEDKHALATELSPLRKCMECTSAFATTVGASVSPTKLTGVVNHVPTKPQTVPVSHPQTVRRDKPQKTSCVLS